MLPQCPYCSSNLWLLAAASRLASTSQIKGKGKEALAIPKRRSMHILQIRFADTRKGGSESSGPKVVVAVDDDGSDEDDAVETGISTHEQESIHDTSGMD
ncbi:uncharacterized protein Pyn_13393 [Prunus yedoensis var. nudiflora]|uniref:Uncharacterized protein n=1 Tax=Prunus yedoensis var. nudiflora TaxID=2094558 RepID=A0A314UB30_PRUYE|nr:uncharacterized protein Pyn_13393 [Prunus yedoensis var. nudiflora]